LKESVEPSSFPALDAKLIRIVKERKRVIAGELFELVNVDLVVPFQQDLVTARIQDLILRRLLSDDGDGGLSLT
jgi:hypothetical protein